MITSHEMTRDEIARAIQNSFVPKKVKVVFHMTSTKGTVGDEEKYILQGATVTEIEEDKK